MVRLRVKDLFKIGDPGCTHQKIEFHQTEALKFPSYIEMQRNSYRKKVHILVRLPNDTTVS